MKNNNTPRLPNSVEKRELVEWLVCMDGLDSEEAQNMVEYVWVSVFDNYITDGPGYAGKLMSVVWGGSPSMFNTFIWQDGKISEVQHELMDPSFATDSPS